MAVEIRAEGMAAVRVRLVAQIPAAQMRAVPVQVVPVQRAAVLRRLEAAVQAAVAVKETCDVGACGNKPSRKLS